jgi:two-component system OmpR family sensor kinase
MQLVEPRTWPIRWRLTALSVAILAATLLTLGGVFLLQLEDALIGITAEHLRDQARPTVQLMQAPRASGQSERARGSAAGQPFSLARAAGFMVRRLSGPDTGVAIFDGSGAVIAATEPDEEAEAWPEPTPELLAAALAGAEQKAIVNQESRRTLVLLFPLQRPDGSLAGVLELAGSLELLDQLQARLRTALIIGTLLAVLAAGILGLRSTRAALRPLDLVVRAARRIGAGHLEERLRLRRRDEIGELGEAFDSMLDRLAATLAAQRRFVADAAHELRTPLTALGGMVEMLQMGADRGDPATVRRMLATMDREINWLGRLVSDLLTLSRLDAEQQRELKPVELAPLVSDVAGQTRVLAHGQDVQLNIADSPTILGDADRLKQVLVNLASNALAFTPPDGRIEFRLDRVNGHARLVVADTGSGIAPDVLPRVMDRFVRGDPSRARATGGTGLGLAIAREIVEAHGGTIALESKVGGGTSAIVDLPLAERPSGNPQVP